MAEIRAVVTVPVTAQFAGLGAPTLCAPLLVESTTGKLYALLTGDLVRQVGVAIVVAAALTATGTVQGDALAITSSVNLFTTVAAGTGARLSSSMAPGDTQLLFNGGASALKVYPDSGSQINSLAANAAMSLSTNTACEFTRVTTTSWIGMLSA